MANRGAQVEKGVRTFSKKPMQKQWNQGRAAAPITMINENSFYVHWLARQQQKTIGNHLFWTCANGINYLILFLFPKRQLSILLLEQKRKER
jgi:hypothetical protein